MAGTRDFFKWNNGSYYKITVVLNKKKNIYILYCSIQHILNYCIELIVNVGGGKTLPRHDRILTQKIRFGQLLFVNWRNKEANRSWQIHDPPWGNAPHVLKKIKKTPRDEFALPKNKKKTQRELKQQQRRSSVSLSSKLSPHAVVARVASLIPSLVRLFPSSSQLWGARTHCLPPAHFNHGWIFYIPWRSKTSIAGKHAHNPAKTIGFPRPGSEGVEHIKPLQTQKHKNVCLKINVQQPCPGRKIYHGTVTECDEAKLARSRVWIAAAGSEVALRTVAAEELAFSFMSRSFASLQHLHLERGTRRCHGRRWKTKEKMGWSQQGGAANALLPGVWVENVVRCW